VPVRDTSHISGEKKREVTESYPYYGQTVRPRLLKSLSKVKQGTL